MVIRLHPSEPGHAPVIAEYRRVHGEAALPAAGGVVPLFGVFELATAESIQVIVAKMIHG
jgi:hypothetical protein